MFKRNDTVSHKKFGTGTVLEARDGKARVQFGDDEKWIAERFLEFVAAGEEEKVNHFETKHKGPLLMAANVKFSNDPPAVVRSYQVNKWIWTRCPIDCDAYQENNRCGHQNVFPIPFLVRLSITEDGRVARGSCSEGRNGEKGPCPDADPDNGCPHVQRAVMAFDGEQPEDDSPLRRFSCDFRNVMSTSRDPLPKCPNCNSSGMVKRAGKNSFICTSGTCMREDARGREQPYHFKPGDGKLKPRWSRISIREGYKWD
jgi:hypothetical protein